MRSDSAGALRVARPAERELTREAAHSGGNDGGRPTSPHQRRTDAPTTEGTSNSAVRNRGRGRADGGASAHRLGRRAKASLAALVALLAIGAAGDRMLWTNTAASGATVSIATHGGTAPAQDSDAATGSTCTASATGAVAAAYRHHDVAAGSPAQLTLTVRVDGEGAGSAEFAARADEALRLVLAGNSSPAWEGLTFTVLNSCGS